MTTLAFFDLDRTLVEPNTALLYARYERSEGRISSRQLARAAIWTLGYHFSLIDMQRAYDQALAHYRGTPADELDARTRAWFRRDVAPLLLPAAREAIDWHRAQGHRLVILSNSSGYQSRVAAETWGFDDAIANEFEVDGTGRLTGRAFAPLCHGTGKIVHAEAFAEREGLSLDGAWFYSDSLSDVPMLARVQNPRVVNPDPRLAREAQRRGWPVLRWRP